MRNHPQPESGFCLAIVDVAIVAVVEFCGRFFFLVAVQLFIFVFIRNDIEYADDRLIK